MNKKMELNFYSIISGEMKHDNGEDSYSIRTFPNGCYMGVFDGCGGIGAQRYEKAGGKTGAFLASRAAAFCMWKNAEEMYEKCMSEEELCESLRKMFSTLDRKINTNSGIRIKGELNKKFPTTAAMVFMRRITMGEWKCDLFWAGDSRCYLLDEDGLAQLSEDDIDENMDAFDNLRADSRLANLISASSDFYLNHKKIICGKPGIIFCATDGVFSYIPSPMEFEMMVLESLCESKGIHDWEIQLYKNIEEYASDDFTMTMAAVGYGNFIEMKKIFLKRKQTLLQSTCLEERNWYKNAEVDEILKRNIWNDYKEGYYRYR